MPSICECTFTVTENDIDVMNHVNNRVYVRWMEQAALYASAQNNWPTERYFQEIGGAWVAREHWVEYLRPVLLGDTVTVFTWVSSLDGASCLRHYAMKNGSKLCCLAATEWVFVNLATRRSMPCPSTVSECFTQLRIDDASLRERGIMRTVRFAPPVGLLG